VAFGAAQPGLLLQSGESGQFQAALGMWRRRIELADDRAVLHLPQCLLKFNQPLEVAVGFLLATQEQFVQIAPAPKYAAELMPPAYNDGAQVALLRRQLEAMADGGTVVISSPVNPARCPPAPYERASLIAHYLKTKKPKSKVIVLDAKESFTMQKLFEAAWAELYPGMIEWIGLSQGGALSSVEAATKTFSTDFDKYKAAVGNVILPAKAKLRKRSPS